MNDPAMRPPSVHVGGGAMNADHARLITALPADLASTFSIVEWAEDEIQREARRHPDCADILYHAFRLLTPSPSAPGMGREFVFRSHAREVLTRVAASTDTRPATAAEICLLCSQASLRVPVHGAAAGLYFRMWLEAFPNHPAFPGQADQQRYYERLHGSAIDDLERLLRRKAADPQRVLGSIDCTGRHHGEPVACRYAAIRAR